MKLRSPTLQKKKRLKKDAMAKYVYIMKDSSSVICNS